MDCLWIQIKKLEDNDWKENQIYRPYLAFEKILSNSTAHDFPLITPPEFSEKSIFPLPRAIFRMFDYTDVPEVSFVLIKTIGRCINLISQILRNLFYQAPIRSKDFWSRSSSTQLSIHITWTASCVRPNFFI